MFGILKNIILFFLFAQLCVLLPAHSKEVDASVRPLLVGQKVASVNLKNLENKNVSFLKLISKKPTVVVFFMGGWCPYCNVKLSQMKAIENALVSLGYQIIAISPDSPANLLEMKANKKLKFKLFSDQEASVAKAFGVSFKPKAGHIRQFKLWQSAAERKGKLSSALPIPSVFLLDSKGKIIYQYVNIDLVR